MDWLLRTPELLWFLAGTVLVGTAVWTYRHLRSYDKLLTAELAKYGHTFVSAKSPPAFDTGPFPKRLGWHLLRRSATVSGIRGQWNTYRIVQFIDADGEEKSAWVWLRFEAFVLKDITWNPQIAARRQRR